MTLPSLKVPPAVEVVGGKKLNCVILVNVPAKPLQCRDGMSRQDLSHIGLAPRGKC